MSPEPNTPPTLDYRAAAEDRWRMPRPSIIAAMLVAFFAALGLYLHSFDRGFGSLFVLPVLLGGFAYVIARMTEASSSGAIRIAKLLLALLVLVTACTLAMREESVFTYARVYGWTSNQAFGAPTWWVLGAALALFAVLDLVDRVWRRRLN